MTDNGEPSTSSKAIASLAKKSSDVTRQGAQKLKFVPTLPARRKKEEVKQEAPQQPAESSDKSNGKRRGKGKARGVEGKAPAPRQPPAEMTASGPFAMGPALVGTSTRHSAPRSNFAPIIPQGTAKGAASGVNLSNSAAPTLRKDKKRESLLVDPAQTPKIESDEEVYSEPDEGVEIVDMENVRQLDWMAPETLRRSRRDRRKRKQVKMEVEEASIPSVSRGPSGVEVDRSNALDLSESEEDELEDLLEDFAMQVIPAEGIHQEQLYFFQFPEPFPTFVSTQESSKQMDIKTASAGPSTVKRKVSFAADVKPPASSSESVTPATQDGPEMSKEIPKVDGIIGHMEVYRSGAVRMRLGNGIVLNVSEATQPSFHQQAVYMDTENKMLHVLGGVNKRFVVSPDLDTLLTALEIEDAGSTSFDDANLIRMDVV